MRLSLPSTLHLAAVGEDTVLLDLADDAYRCLPAAAWAIATSPASRICDVDDEAVARQLKAFGATPSDQQLAPRRAPPALPVRAAEAERVRAGAMDRWRFARALQDIQGGYVGQGLEAVLGFRPPMGPSPEPVDETELARLAGVFGRMMLWTPGASKCLLRAFLLRRFLQRSGLHADWVFGVQTWPFTAHCWIQVGDVVLDERPEHLAAFTPILVV